MWCRRGARRIFSAPLREATSLFALSRRLRGHRCRGRRTRRTLHCTLDGRRRSERAHASHVVLDDRIVLAMQRCLREGEERTQERKKRAVCARNGDKESARVEEGAAEKTRLEVPPPPAPLRRARLELALKAEARCQDAGAAFSRDRNDRRWFLRFLSVCPSPPAAAEMKCKERKRYLTRTMHRKPDNARPSQQKESSSVRPLCKAAKHVWTAVAQLP
ncbi:hypothetical protein MTO96_015827 [Rhipicephalus appendiculatus]